MTQYLLSVHMVEGEEPSPDAMERPTRRWTPSTTS